VETSTLAFPMPHDVAPDIASLLARAARGADDDDTPASRSRRRGREIVLLRENGFSLDEIAERYEVSRERVRQILHANDGPAREEAEMARRRRMERQAAARITELLARWRAGDALAVIARDLSIPSTTCSKVIAQYATDMDRVARRTSLARTRGPSRKYSDRDIVDALVLVATELGEVPTPRQYGARTRELGLPSLPTVLNRTGGWKNALQAAGMHPTSPARNTRQPRWTEAECWRVLHRVVRDLGDVPSLRSYERLIADRADMPSSSTLRNRLGRWSAIVGHLTAAHAGALCSASAPVDEFRLT
jgi:DNA-binding transcriptional MerR regulator